MQLRADADLHGCRVLVTRPVAQASSFCDCITEQGGIAVQLPMLAIEAIQEQVSQTHCQSANDYDWLIFISRNAVEHADVCLPMPLPSTVKIAAIGTATASALSQRGLHVALEAAGTSEALLSEHVLNDMHGQRVLIMRGQGGRELLAETLRGRGAEVNYADLYRRYKPETLAGELSTVLNTGIDILAISSGETLENLLTLAAEEQCEITHFPLVVMSERVQILACERGFTDTIIATEASDAGMVDAIKHWYENSHNGASA